MRRDHPVLWLGLLAALATGSSAPAAELVIAPGTGAELRRAPASCGAGPTLFVDRGSPFASDDALLRVRGRSTESVVPAIAPWRDPQLVCAGDDAWVWMWRDDGETPVTGLFPIVGGGFGAGVTLDGRWLDPRPSPSGRFVVVREDGGEGAQTLVELGTRRTRPLVYGGAVTDGAWLPGTDRLVVVVDEPERGPMLSIWDPSSRAAARELRIGGKHAQPGTLSLAPNGRTAALAVGDLHEGLRVVDLGSGEVTKVAGPGGRAVWSPSSRALAALSVTEGRRELVVWRAGTGEAHRTPLPRSPLGLVVDGDDAVLATWLDERRLVLGSRWGTEPVRMFEAGRLRELRTPDLALDSLARTADGDLWAVGRGEVWRIPQRGKVVRVPTRVEAAAVSVRPDDTLLVLAKNGEDVVRLPPSAR